MIDNVVKILSTNSSLSNDDKYLKNLAASISFCELNSKYLQQYTINNLDSLTGE